ncbi:MAG: MerR family transcriptional regulator [Candidatus Riflebacteria bacterium]|nr:MerR family transcriptional regulator [Candidatus Riflebacteria bacterium]
MTAPDKAKVERSAHEEWTMDELIEHVREGVLRLVVSGQSRYKVTDVPDARTVRYYISMGLVDQPTGKRGTFALYSGMHLLQILAIKKLQAQYLTIRKIQELIHGRSPDELQELLGESVRLEELVVRPSPVKAGAPWLRHELGPGIELHVKQGFTVDPSELQEILDTVAGILKKPVS